MTNFVQIGVTTILTSIGMDGLAVCREIRSHSPTPVVFLSSRDEELDRVVGLEIGGDDYVTKPFSPRELVARVRAVLRRSAPIESTTEEPVHQVGALTLNSARFEVTVSGQTLPLTLTEFNLLKTFMVRPGIVFTRQQILDRVYGLDVVVSDRTIDSHVRRLRRKFAALGADPIETVHGLGYRLREAAE
ncbi:MAG: two-component system OmpR family response regulator [Myxococcota bacterium]|jgi:two-component system OmpR family response regulator